MGRRKSKTLSVTPKGFAWMAMNERVFPCSADSKEFADFWDRYEFLLRQNGYHIPGEPVVDPKTDDFGTILNCAVRYALGRRTYMPSLVIGYITPLLPQLSSKTLWCFDQDVTDAKYIGGYGDPCDEKDWMRFLDAVRAERTNRGEELYRSHMEKQ